MKKPFTFYFCSDIKSFPTGRKNRNTDNQFLSKRTDIETVDGLNQGFIIL